MTRLRKMIGRWYSFLRHPNRYLIAFDRGFHLMPLISGGLPETIDNQTARQSSLDRLAVMLDSVSNHNLFMGLQNVDTATAAGAAGGATALPATPLGYAYCSVGGAVVKIPYYLP